MIFNPVFTKRDTANPSAKAVHPSAVYTLIKIETPSNSSPTFYHTVEVISGNSGFRTFNSNDYLVSSMTGTPENASGLINTPSGSISATTIQGAINELAIEKAPLSHTHDSIDIYLANSGTIPSGTEVENLNTMLGYTGAPHSHIFPFNIWLKSAGMPGELMLELAKNNRADKLITPAMSSTIRRFYSFAENNGLLTKNAGGINPNGARLLLPVFPSGYANANYINWLNPRDNVAVPKTSVDGANGIFVTPGGEIYQSGSNGANIDAGMTPRLIFDGEYTQISAGTPTNGTSYVIIDNSGGADFTPAGAANNNLETSFTANGSGVTWGAGKLQKLYLPKYCVAYYSRLANAGGADDNFWGGRDDTLAYNAGHRYFMTANSTNLRFSPGWTASSFDSAHSSVAKGLILFSLDIAYGHTFRQVKKAGNTQLQGSAGALAEATYGMVNKSIPVRFFTYFNAGGAASLHDRPSSLLYAGLGFHKDTSHTLTIEMSNVFHDLAVAMAQGTTPSWTPV